MDIWEILKIILPAIVVLVTAYLLIDKLLKNDERRRRFELHKNNLSTTTPIRLRAYERLTLVLERTNPNLLIINTVKPGMTNLELQTLLLSSIREEFSHNLSQQIYVSNECWEYFRTAQESLLKLVNTCAVQCNPTENAGILAERIIQVFGNSDRTPTELAIEKLKNEVRTLFAI